MTALHVALVLTVLWAAASTAHEDFTSPSNLRLSVDAKDEKNVRADVEWDFDTETPDSSSSNVIRSRIDRAASETSETEEKDSQDFPTFLPLLDDMKTLQAPYDVQVAELDTNNILVGWKMDPPTDSEVGNIRYRLDYRADSGESHSLNVTQNPVQLKNLQKSSNYTLTVTAMLKDYKDGVAEPVKFKTRDQDWPAAVFKKATVLSRNATEKAVYDLTWDNPEIRSVDRFRILICASNCQETSLLNNEQHQEYSLVYGQPYNVTVTTVYKLPLNQTITRVSEIYKGTATVGRPGPAESVNITQTLNNLTLSWKPPKVTRGPVSHYEINVFDALNPLVNNTRKVPGLETAITLPLLTEKQYGVTVIPVAVDATTEEEFRSDEPMTNNCTLTLLDPPKDVTVSERKSNFLKLEVTPSSDLNDIVYKVVWAANKGGMFGPKSLKVDKLRPYEEVEFNVSSCFMDDINATYCGEVLTRRGRSNVAAPLKVENLTLKLKGDNSIRATWEKPSVTNGPLDGYEIHLSKSEDPAPILENLTLDGADVLHDFNVNESSSKYTVTIKAFNIDRESKVRIYGDAASAERTDRTDRTVGTAGWVVPVVVLLVLLVVGGLAGGFYVYRRRMSASGSSTAVYSFFNRGNDA